MPATNRFATAPVRLASAVADSGTFTLAYPTGTSQRTFNVGLANAAGHYAIVNGNDKWTSAASKMSVSFGASLITVTNSSGVSWPAGSDVILYLDTFDGNDIVFLSFPVNLASITTTQDVVTEFRPGIAGTIEALSFVVNAPVTTASKAVTLNAEIGTTNVTGGQLSLTSANCTPMGAIIESTAITGANVLTPESQLSIEAASVTAFAEGSGTVIVRIRKTDAYA